MTYESVPFLWASKLFVPSLYFHSSLLDVGLYYTHIKRNRSRGVSVIPLYRCASLPSNSSNANDMYIPVYVYINAYEHRANPYVYTVVYLFVFVHYSIYTSVYIASEPHLGFYISTDQGRSYGMATRNGERVPKGVSCSPFVSLSNHDLPHVYLYKTGVSEKKKAKNVKRFAVLASHRGKERYGINIIYMHIHIPTHIQRICKL